VKNDIGAVLPALIMIFAVFAAFVSSVKKASAKQQQQQHQARPQPQKHRDAQQKPQSKKPARPAAAIPDYVPIQPTIRSEHDHDHAGSLGDLNTEGYDPCHDDQLDPAVDPALAQPQAAPAGASSGLKLSWTGDEMVRGFVMGEILKRKH